MGFPVLLVTFGTSRTTVELAVDYSKTMPVERILVVDDEETHPRNCLLHADRRGLQVPAGGFRHGSLALLESGEEFELMLSDLMMANLDGIGLLERTKERNPDMPVVMVTAVHEFRWRWPPSATAPTITC